MKHLLLTILAIAIFTPIVFAQTKTVNVDTVLVTASKVKQSTSETGKVTEVITSKDLEQLPINSVDEALRYITGVEVQTRNAFGAQADIGIRGTTFNQNLILIDGVRLNDPLTGHFNGYVPVPLSAIDRIEVTKGAASAIYGADAVGGVINIVTKNSTIHSKEDGTELTGEINYGSNKSWNNSAYFASKSNKVGITAGFNMNKAEGEELVNPNFEQNPVAKETFFNDFDIKTLSVGLSVDVNDHLRLTTFHGFDSRDFAAKYFYTRSTFDESREKTQIMWHNAKLLCSKEKNDFEVGIGYKRSKDYFAFNPLFTPNDHITQVTNGQLVNTHTFSKKFKLSTGFQADYRTIESNDRGNHFDWHTGIYAVGFIKPVDRLNLTLSARFDYDEGYGTAFLPQLNASYVFNKVVLRGSAGLTSRAPDYTERYISNNLASLSAGRNLGNPDLEEEQSFSAELGLDIYPTNSIKLSTTGFMRNSQNLIDYILTPSADINLESDVQLDPMGSYFFTQNLEEVRTYGIESQMRLTPKLSEKSRLHFTLGHIYMQSENDEDVLSKYIANHSKHIVTGNVVLTYEDFYFGIDGLWKDRGGKEVAQAINAQTSISYEVFNMKLGYRFSKPNLGINLRIMNIFDEEYEDILGAKMNGTWVMGGITWQLID